MFLKVKFGLSGTCSVGGIASREPWCVQALA